MYDLYVVRTDLKKAEAVTSDLTKILMWLHKDFGPNVLDELWLKKRMETVENGIIAKNVFKVCPTQQATVVANKKLFRGS